MRYIDEDALIKKIYPMGIGDGMYVINAKAVKFAIDNTPTADVVPKSEYDAAVSAVDYCTQEFLRLHDDYQEAKREFEMLQGALKAEERHNELTMEMAKKALANAKAEVAREIFEELKQKRNELWNTGKYTMFECWCKAEAELKNKYTEDKE